MGKEDSIAIVIAYSKSVEDSKILDFICYGIEEEGIPYKLVAMDIKDAISLAKEGAKQSKLGIGLSLDEEGKGCLNHSNFKDDKVLFLKKIKTEEDARILGTNGARLMKGIPFKMEGKAKN
ncbi:MAG: glycerol dehydratase reactivase beta/small subunit family protein [Tissierellia bacterium]|nr:glycerol dehydratase reactivase beta/small subunit family protein [Tissierellia bacterium]